MLPVLVAFILQFRYLLVSDGCAEMDFASALLAAWQGEDFVLPLPACFLAREDFVCCVVARFV